MLRGVSFSPDGKTIAAGYSVVGDVRRRGGAVGRGRAEAPGGRPLPVKEGYVTGVAFSPDGKTIAAGYSVGGDVGGGVVVWDVAARKRLVGRPPPREGGRCHGRGLQPRRQDHRGRTRRPSAAAAVWCCGTWPRGSAWRTTPYP